MTESCEMLCVLNHSIQPRSNLTEMFLLLGEIRWCEIKRDTTGVAGKLFVPESTPEGAIPLRYGIAMPIALVIADESICIDGRLIDAYPGPALGKWGQSEYMPYQFGDLLWHNEILASMVRAGFGHVTWGAVEYGLHDPMSRSIRASLSKIDSNAAS
jgi:hypothetical protein